MQVQTVNESIKDYKEAPAYYGSTISIFEFNRLSGAARELGMPSFRHAMSLIQEEVTEASADLEANDLEGFCKEMADVYVTVVGMLQKLENLGVDTKAILESVAMNNLSKYPYEKKDAEDTVKFYKDQGIDVKVSYNSRYRRYIIRDTEGKIRKPHNYVKADVSYYIPKGVKIYD